MRLINILVILILFKFSEITTNENVVFNISNASNLRSSCSNLIRINDDYAYENGCLSTCKSIYGNYEWFTFDDENAVIPNFYPFKNYICSSNILWSKQDTFYYNDINNSNSEIIPFRKEIISCDNNRYVYKIQKYLEFIPCYFSKPVMCPENYTSDTGYFPNCVKPFPYDLYNIKIITVLFNNNTNGTILEAYIDYNLDERHYNDPSGLLTWYVQSNNKNEIIERSVVSYNKVNNEWKILQSPGKINLAKILTNPISKENNASVYFEFLTNKTFDKYIEGNILIKSDFYILKNTNTLIDDLINQLNSTDQGSQTVEQISSISYNLLIISQEEKNETLINESFDLIDLLLNVPDETLFAAQQSTSSSSDIIRAAENLLNNNISVNISTKNIKASSFNVNNIELNLLNIGIVLNKNSSFLQPLFNKNDLNNINFTYAAFLNEDSINATDISDLRLQTIEYSKNSLFQVSTKEKCRKELINNQIVSVATNLELQPVNNSLVTIVYSQFNRDINDKKCNLSDTFEYKCAFWNFTLNNNNGGWDTTGCFYEINNSIHFCTCNHTTNFALLISFYVSPPNCKWCDDALYFLSLIGSILSIFFLILSIITLIRSELARLELKRRAAKIRFDGMYYHYPKLMIILCINLIIFNVFFITVINVDSKKISIEACEAVGIILHYFLLSSFFLMAFMALLRYFLTVKVFTDFKHYNMIAVISAYIISALIIIICIFVPSGPSKYITSKNLCWLGNINDLMFVIIPLGIICVFNLLLFITMIYGFYRQKINFKDEDREFQMCKFFIGTIFICGLTWLFGILIIIPIPTEFVYIGFLFALIFCFLNAFQGVFIFIVAILIRKLQLNDIIAKKKSYDFSGSGSNDRSTTLTSFDNTKSSGSIEKYTKTTDF